MDRLSTLEDGRIIPDNNNTAPSNVSQAARNSTQTRSPLAREARDQGTTGKQRFASKLPSCRHTDDGDINSCSHTNMTNTNPSDVESLSCGSGDNARDLLKTTLREIIQKLSTRCRSLSKGCRKGVKKPTRTYYKFYKPMHLWSLPIYAKTTSAIRYVSYRQASTVTNRKSDHGLYAHLLIRGELNVLDEDPATAVKLWRNRFNVFGQFFEDSNHVLSLAKQVEVHTQKISWTLLGIMELILSVAKLVLLCFQRYIVTPILDLVSLDSLDLLDTPDFSCPDCSSGMVAQSTYLLVSSEEVDHSCPDCSSGMVAQSTYLLVSSEEADYSCPDCSSGMVAPSTYLLVSREKFDCSNPDSLQDVERDMWSFLNELPAQNKLVALMNAGPSSASILEKIPILQLTKTASADNTRKWCDQVEDAFEIMFAESDNWRYLTEGRPLTSQTVQARTAALRAVEEAAASYTSADAYTTALIEAQSKLTEANLRLEDTNLRMWQSLYSRISKASRDEMSLRFTAIFEAMKDRKDLPMLYHLAIVVHSFPAMQEQDMFDHQLKIILNLKMSDTESNAIEWNKGYMQHLELLAYSYDLAYSAPSNEQPASNPLAAKLFSTSSSATSVCISRIDWPFLRYAYVKALNIDYFMMMDSPADREKFNNIVMKGNFKSLMDEVIMWMEKERIQNRGKYSHPRDRIPGRALASHRSQNVAFSVTEESREENPVIRKYSDKQRGRTTNMNKHSSSADRSRSGSADSRNTRRRRSGSTSSAESSTRQKARQNYKSQSGKQGIGAKYDSRLDSKTPANKCEYCSLVHKHDQKRLQWITHTLSDCRSLRKHTEQGNIHPDWRTGKDKQRKSKSYANVSISEANRFSTSDQLTWTEKDRELLEELGVTTSFALMSRSSSSTSKEVKALTDALSPPPQTEHCCQICFSTPLQLTGERCSECGQFASNDQLEDMKRKRTLTARFSDIPESFSATKFRQSIAPETPDTRIRNSASRRPTPTVAQAPGIQSESADDRPYASVNQHTNPIVHSMWQRFIHTDPPPHVAAKLKDALCTVECGIRKLSGLVDDSACLHTRLAHDLQNSLENSLYECMHRYELYRETLLTVAYARSAERFIPQSPTDIPPNRPELAERSTSSSPILLSDSSDSTLVDTSNMPPSEKAESNTHHDAFNSTEDSEDRDIGPCDLLLDSGTTHHLLSMNLARILDLTVATLPSSHTFHGVGGSVTATHFGHLCAFRQCFFCEYSRNLISMSFLQRQDFTLIITLNGIRISHPEILPAGLEFRLRGGLYVYSIPCRVSDDLQISRVYSVTQYTTDQIRLAKLMRKFHEDTGHRSPREERESSNRGGITGAPVVNAQLQNLTNAILGPCSVCVMGKSVAAVKIRRPLRERSSTIGSVQHIDMFFLKCRITKANIPHWIFVDEASANVFIWHCTDRTRNSFREALSQVTGYYLKFHHAPPKTLISDGEGAVAAYEEEFNSVGGQIHFVARNQHVALAECYIGKLKTIMRTILASITFKWPTCFFTYLVDEAVQLLRLRATVRSNGVPLCELVEHRKPDFTRMFHRFGDYVLAVTPSDNRIDDLSPRADPAIILYRPLHGILVYIVYLLNTKGVARRRTLKIASATDSVVDSINAISNVHVTVDESIQSADVPTLDSNELADMEFSEPEPEQPPIKDSISAPEIVYLHANQKPGRKPKYSRVLEPREDMSVRIDEAAIDTEATAPSEEIVTSDPVMEETSQFPAAEPDQSVVSTASETDSTSITDTEATSTEISEPRPTRIRRKPERYGGSVYHLNEDSLNIADSIDYDSIEENDCWSREANAATKGNYNLRSAAKKDPSKTELASEQEFQTLLDKDTFRPVRRNQLTPEQDSKTIRGFTFLKEKLHIDGSLDRWKARFVAGGHMVDSSQLGPLHSSTVQLATVFLLFSLAAQFGWKISNTDVTAAYLNTRLPVDQRLPMIMGKEETAILLKLRPDWSQYVGATGTMLVLIYGGIYGLPQSALLWYKRLVEVFLDLGYFISDTDQACFIRIDGNSKSVIIIHVDDILHFYTESAHEIKLQKRLKSEFGNVTCNSTDVGIYLGIEYTFQRKDKSVFLHMSKYVNKILSDANIQKQRPAPCTESFGKHDPEDSRCDQHTFASGVMSLYYLAMRTRPDIQVYTSFLASKIHNCTDADLRKLYHLYAFLNHTKNRGVTLKSRGTTLHFSMDASYNIHPNCRSHSGFHVTLGEDEHLPKSPYGGPIVVLSHVQKFVASSSTEAEIIAVFVYHQHVLALRSLLMNLGFDQQTPSVIHQDNQAAITILTRGAIDKGSTRHLQMRIARIYELVTDGIIKLVYCPTEDMQADAPSKPLHSKQDMNKLLRLCNSDV